MKNIVFSTFYYNLNLLLPAQRFISRNLGAMLNAKTHPGRQVIKMSCVHTDTVDTGTVITHMEKQQWRSVQNLF